MFTIPTLFGIILSIEVVKDNHLLSDEERNYFDYYTILR